MEQLFTEIAIPQAPIIDRDEKGRIIKGIAQDTNKHGITGRPCMFCQKKDELLAKSAAYLDRCKKGRDGKPVMPFVEELAMELNTTDENIVNWADKIISGTSEREHPEFFTIYSLVKMLQKLRLKQRALGRYNPAGALSLLRFDHGAMETNKQVLGTDKNEPLQITITEERPYAQED